MTGVVVVSNGCRASGCGVKRAKREVNRQSQLSSIALLMATIKKSMVHCKMNFGEEDQEAFSNIGNMEISWPTEVQHVAHVTFDRFNGFLGLPAEFQVQIPCPAPSASVSVFGVSSESMQCSYDSNGNSVPTILLLMQERLYSQGGLKAEGIFRITPENSEEKDLRNQLNKGIIPEDIDVHCLAALIKAWFRELPEGVLDSLSPGQVLQCETEEDCYKLVKSLPATQFALLSWAIDLMADVVEEEDLNKMNVRNISMVFAPNMTQLSDPLTSLMHAVQVMNLLQTLIFRTLREREDASLVSSSCSSETCSDGGNSEIIRESDVSETIMEEDPGISENSSYDLNKDIKESKDTSENSINADDIRENKSDESSMNDRGEYIENNSDDMCYEVQRETNSRFSFHRNDVYEEDENTDQCFLSQLVDLAEDYGVPQKEGKFSGTSTSDQETRSSYDQETRSSYETCITKFELKQGSTSDATMESNANMVDNQDETCDVKPKPQIEDHKLVVRAECIKMICKELVIGD